MRRLIVIVAFAFFVVGGATISVAQDEATTDEVEIGAPAICGTPAASPAATPDLEMAAASPDVAIAVTPEYGTGTPAATPASALGCATPEVGTPPS
jgi:hypothetical protein